MAAVRSSDGVNVNVDLVLTLGIEDPVKFAYTITTGDLDEFIHATSQEAVRLLVRGIEALSALDLGSAEAALLRASVDAKLESYGVGVRNVAFTRVMLPDAITASLEARRLAAIQLSEEQENFALEERRLNDRANLIALEQESRHKALELEAQAEALRLSKLDERLRAYPTAAQYDLETQRIKVAQQLAGNTRAVVSMGGNDLSRRAARRAAGRRRRPAGPTPATVPRRRPRLMPPPLRPRAGPSPPQPAGRPRGDARRADRRPALCSPGDDDDRSALRHGHPPDRRDAARDGRRRGRRRRVRRRPDGERARGAGGRAARQGRGPVRVQRHAGQPRRR